MNSTKESCWVVIKKMIRVDMSVLKTKNCVN